MSAYLAVALGGGLGGVLRYAVSGFVDARFGSRFPWGTLAVNVGGSLLMGALMALIVRGAGPGGAASVWVPFLTVGFCGAFTTVSSFAVRTVTLLEQEAVGRAFLNVGATLLLTLIATLGGFALAGGDLQMLAAGLERGAG